MSERLADLDRRDALRCHARHFQTLATAFLVDADTRAEPDRLAQVVGERHNMLAALGWFEQHDQDGALVFGPALGLERRLRGDQHEAHELLRRLLAAAPDAPEAHIAWTEESLAWPEFLSGDVDQALAHDQDPITRFEAMGNPPRTQSSTAKSPRTRSISAAPTKRSPRRSTCDRSKWPGRRTSSTRWRRAVEFAHSLTASEQFAVVDVESMLSTAEDVMRRHRDDPAWPTPR